MEYVVFPFDNQNIPYCPGYRLLAYVTNVDVYIFAQKKGNVIKRKMIKGRLRQSKSAYECNAAGI